MDRLKWIQAYYLDRGCEKTYKHVLEVSKVAIQLAMRFGLDLKACEEAALLHDISAVLNPLQMLEIANRKQWKLDLAEEKYPFLLHQRVSGEIAREEFGVADTVILNAITCHTTLKRSASKIDMVVFLADKLAWDQPGVPPYQEAVLQALDVSLPYGCLVYLQYQFDHGSILMPHSWLLEAYSWLKVELNIKNH